MHRNGSLLLSWLDPKKKILISKHHFASEERKTPQIELRSPHSLHSNTIQVVGYVTWFAEFFRTEKFKSLQILFSTDAPPDRLVINMWNDIWGAAIGIGRCYALSPHVWFYFH